MGLESDLLVHPERLSPQLICPICTQVLRNPVQTPSEHLFCEDELLEWMTISNICPVTKVQLLPQDIKRPSRIIINMLAELEIYCFNKSNGCTWTGLNEQLNTHLLKCQHKPAEDLKKELMEKDERINYLTGRISLLETKCAELEAENKQLRSSLNENSRKLRVFNAFTESQQARVLSVPRQHYSEDEYEEAVESTSDLARLNRLKTLNHVTKLDKK